MPGRLTIENDKETVLLRSYGRDSNIMINRETEVTTHVLLAERGLASPLLARFQNGLLYRFFPGHVCTAHNLQQDLIWEAITARLGEWHARLLLPILKTATSNPEEDKGTNSQESGTDQSLGQSRTIWTVI